MDSCRHRVCRGSLQLCPFWTCKVVHFYFATFSKRGLQKTRKNFVIIESDNGAKASAILYSLVETAKANDLNPYKYFELLLSELPKHMDDKDLKFLDSLMPWSSRVQRKCHSLNKKS